MAGRTYDELFQMDEDDHLVTLRCRLCGTAWVFSTGVTRTVMQAAMDAHRCPSGGREDGSISMEDQSTLGDREANDGSTRQVALSVDIETLANLDLWRARILEALTHLLGPNVEKWAHRVVLTIGVWLVDPRDGRESERREPNSPIS